MGYLKQIDVENFKSWRGKQVIGPFMRFNCIIGTNGSGKSNVMEALSFVMGERASTLRVKHIRDLIHGAHVGRPVANTASVAMTYRQDADDTVFSRSISGDSSEYRVNDRRVTLAKYTEELEKIGVVTKARNCLVFQGAVESITMKNPKERTKMFEHISQSRELAEDYEKKKEAMQKAKENTQFIFSRKRAAASERKQITLDKQEAQKYQALVDERSQGRLQLSLFQLYHNQQGIAALGRSLAERQQEAGAAKSSLEALEQEVKGQKKEHGRLSRDLQGVEKEIRGQGEALSQHRAQYIKTKVNTSHHAKKAEDARSALKRSQRLTAKKQEELDEGARDLAELERAWRSYERQARQEGAERGGDIQLEEEQLTRYKELKQLAMKQGGVLGQQAEKLHWEVRADHEKISFDRRRKKEVEANIKNNQNQLEDLTRRAGKLEEYTNTCKASLEEYREQEESLGAELERGRQRTEEVNQELGQLLEQQGDAHLQGHESRRQQRRKEVLENLCRLHPDTVHGRLVDLCSPIHKKYQLAVIKVFGRYLNSIVVTSEEVARDCIRFIKEERSEPETFLPIDYLMVSPLNERLREAHGAKMVVDVVQCTSELKKVVQFVCGNAVVCETLKEAKRVAFEGPERVETVSLDGTKFSKSGVISGGSSDLRYKARHWDEKDMRQLKERKERLTTELRGLMKLRRKESELKQIQSQTHGVQTRLKYSQSELKNIHKKSIPTCQVEISRLESELANVESAVLMQQKNVEEKDSEMKTFKDRIDKMEDVVFADFCAEIGVDNIREYEQEYLKQQTELDKKRLEFENQCTRLSGQLAYAKEQLEQQSSKQEKVEETIAKQDTAVAVQKKEEEKLLLAVEASQAEERELKERLWEKRSQVADSKAALDQRRESLQDSSRELLRLQRKVIQVETSLEQKCLAKHNLLLGCKVQGLDVSLVSGSLDDISQVQLESDSEVTATSTEIYEKEAQVVIDYSALGPHLKRMEAEKEVEAQVEVLMEAVSSVDAVLQRTSAPNLKALEKMREVKEMFQEVLEAFDASSREARRCSKEFELVKAQRFRLFSQCFEHVCVVIDQIYKRLSQNTSAQAILSAENPDEPYLDGINYNCVAPGKRFMAMSNLSGGEKAIAALALVFAIHSFRPAPFFVLDEVDAALDNTNIGKVTRFIREESRENMQIIVISLKEEFYSRADALLGVYPEFTEGLSSRILTLDLRPYSLNDDDHKQREKQPGGDGSLVSNI